MRPINSALLILLLFSTFSQTAIAQTPMRGGSYKIESGSANPDIIGQENRSTVKVYGSYSFAVSESLIDFGKIVPTNPLTRKNIISLDSSKTNYFLKAYENHQLLSPKSGVITDTTCDSGSCSEQTSSAWKNVLAFGFGFRCENVNNNCGQEFPDANSYMQFADKSKNEPYNSLLSKVSGKNQLELTYKLNISSQQRPGAYSNSVTLLSLPSY